MGGTSTDICLIVDGEPALAAGRGRGRPAPGAQQPRHRHPRRRRRFDRPRRCAAGILHVGPASAGAVPGPACYGHGGTEADGDRRQPGARLSRSARISSAAADGLDVAAAEANALDRLGRRSWGCRPRHAAAEGVHRVVNQHGGGHPAGLGAPRRRSPPLRAAVVRRRGRAARHRRRAPARASTASSCRASRRCCRRGACWRPICATRCRAPISATPAQLDGTRACRPAVRRDGSRGPDAAARIVRRPDRVQRSAVEMRYGEQIFEIAVPLDEVDWRRCDDPLPQIVERFHQRPTRHFTATRCATSRRCW